MATIKKISGVGDVGALTTSHRLLVEAPNGTLGSTTVGAVNNHTHSYAGSSEAGGPATEFVASTGTDNADRYVYFAYNNTTYNNSDPTKIGKGRAVVDSEFKYNPYTNKLSTGSVSTSSVQLSSKVTLQYNSSTESLDFVFV